MTSKKNFYQVIEVKTGQVAFDNLTQQEAIDKVTIHTTKEKPLDIKRIRK
jgi:hypothetical protein